MNRTRNQLPSGYTLVEHPVTKIRFVRTPDGKLVPNQGGRKKPGHPVLDADDVIIADFKVWLRKQSTATDPRLPKDLPFDLLREVAYGRISHDEAWRQVDARGGR